MNLQDITTKITDVELKSAIKEIQEDSVGKTIRFNS